MLADAEMLTEVLAKHIGKAHFANETLTAVTLASLVYDAGVSPDTIFKRLQQAEKAAWSGDDAEIMRTVISRLRQDLFGSTYGGLAAARLRWRRRQR